MIAEQPKDVSDDWDMVPSLDVEEGDVLIIDLDGFEGPLDLLLALSRAKKIDLKALSIAALAEQYISYINNLKKHRLEIAADYLVMAAWLAFLKSKLLLPQLDEVGDEPSAQEMAARLAFRLARLDAMRAKAQELMARGQLGFEFFAAGAPEGLTIAHQVRFQSDQYRFLKAYAEARHKEGQGLYQVKKRQVWSIKKAKERLQALLGFPIDWAPIQELVLSFIESDALAKTTVASTFGASLEMARDGEIELRQEAHFQPLYVKVRGGRGQS